MSTTGAAFFKDLLLVALLKSFRINIAYHIHNKGVISHQDNIINKFCYSYVLKNAYIILLSKFLYHDIQSFVPESKILICPNGVPDEARKSNLKVSFPILLDTAELQPKVTSKSVRILFLSNLIESKGVFILMEACALLKERGIPFDCLFIGGEGDINSTQFREKSIQLCIDQQVKYVGKKFDLEKNKAFENADIFAFPTYSECFPLVLLEAMSYSLPIISTFEGGIKDIVEEGVTGFLVEQKNVIDLADKIELLIKNPDLRHKLGTFGRKKYEKEFIFEIFENRLNEILQQIIVK